MDPLWFTLALLAMLVGLVGTIVPFMPGVLLVLGAAYAYAFATGLEGGIGVTHLVVYTLATGLVLLFDLVANAVGTKAAGGSKWGAIGAVVGLVVGLVLGGPIGLLVGPFLGAFVFELAAHREARLALRSGVGAAVGFLASTILEVAVALGIVASFVFAVLTAG